MAISLHSSYFPQHVSGAIDEPLAFQQRRMNELTGGGGGQAPDVGEKGHRKGQQGLLWP